VTVSLITLYIWGAVQEDLMEDGLYWFVVTEMYDVNHFVCNVACYVALACLIPITCT